MPWGVISWVAMLVSVVLFAHESEAFRKERDTARKNFRVMSDVANRAIAQLRGPHAAKTDEWQLFIEALIAIESSGNPDAIGDGGQAVGLLQIHPRTVDECNRILKRNEFTLDDRLSRERSVEMFEVIQEHYNPERDIHLAAKAWNPRAPLSYHRRIIEKINELKQQP